MSDQIQCPNCGGYRVTAKRKELLDPRTGRRAGSCLEVVLLATMQAFLYISVVTPCAVVGVFLQRGRAGVPHALLLLVLGAAMFLVTRAGTAYFTRRYTVERLHLECQLCGYRWSWRTDEPLLQYRADPELIQRGAQKLSEEAEARRLQEQAAAQFLDHQRRQQKK